MGHDGSHKVCMTSKNPSTHFTEASHDFISGTFFVFEENECGKKSVVQKSKRKFVTLIVWKTISV